MRAAAMAALSDGRGRHTVSWPNPGTRLGTMARHASDPGIGRVADRSSPDDFVEDVLCEKSNLDTQDTNVPGTIVVSTALGSPGPRVT
ncbi:hypothetical protein MMSR116_20090 [Methylobacterium mesophilicum SR1.6/6]|uniref:Uncharacterized protein n=1 Tax=Methylobacterium mesophilicum SR1.6/6 TaxID=908290 RepID=A0A6B9FMU7_9HYPH|nr:hypothetical protein [Methylobacterium mesophilicum]QGY03941.1 hypothetical protein MMSR116_20090 [Methylobacterium mesophilicum SR1.6/6]